MIRRLVVAAAVVAMAACIANFSVPADDGAPAPHGKTCGGIAGLSCAQGQYCRMTGPLHPDKSGVCTAKPEMCMMLYQPVCGLDGKTYANDCVAAQHGMSVASKGACPGG